MRRLKSVLLILIAVLFFAGLLIVGTLPRLQRQKKIETAAQAIKNSNPTVAVVMAKDAPASSGLELPGNIEAIQVATISARASGYLRRWHVDIGDRVRAGQLLAEIDTPEIDKQLQQAHATVAQARSSLAQAEANLNQSITDMEFARVSYERWKILEEQHVVPVQDTDQKKAAYDAAKATVDAMKANINVNRSTIWAYEANVRRLEDLTGFKRVIAPFTGIITARNVEVGSLINAGSSSELSTSIGATPSSTMIPGYGTTQLGTGASSMGGGLFQIARVDTLRIFISVPQAFVSSIRTGLTTEISVREFPQIKFSGRVVRTANALDPASRTLLTEIHIPNSDYQLMAGMYATVNFNTILANPPVRIPATALVVRADGPQVVVVTNDQKAHYQKVVIERDYGGELDIISGIEAGATLVINVPDGLADGSPVTVRPSQPANQPGGQQTQQSQK